MDVYNRAFDDQSQIRIRLETMAIDILFELIERKDYELVWSFIPEYENSRNPFRERKLHIKSVSSMCKGIIEPNDKIGIIANRVMGGSNIRAKDALHLASAIYAECNYFITCDDGLIKTIMGNYDKIGDIVGSIKLYNPLDFLRKEMDVNVIE